MIFEALESGALPVKFSSVISAGWTNITSTANIDVYWSYCGRDYKYARKQIMLLLEVTAGVDYSNFAALSANDKLLACKWAPNKVGAVNFATTITDAAQRQEILKNFDVSSQFSRQTRYNALRIYILSKSQITDALNLLKDADKDGLVQSYVGGIEGTEQGDPVGLFDFIQAVTGTEYQSTGMAARAITPIDGSTLASVVTGCMDIIKNGNY